MKPIVFIFISLFLTSIVFAQQNGSNSANDSSSNYSYVETMSDFPGGQVKLMKFIQKNLRYPPEARKNGVEGKVILKFVINEDGSITDIQVVRPLEPSCDQEAIRLVQSMPKWSPGLQKGKPVKVYFKLPITFKLGT